jgi:hypothetical protein
MTIGFNSLDLAYVAVAMPAVCKGFRETIVSNPAFATVALIRGESIPEGELPTTIRPISGICSYQFHSFFGLAFNLWGV